MSKLRTGEGGFTLVELLVVILIIGVLASIAIPSFLGQRAKANDAGAITALRTARTAIEVYRTDHGSYCGADVGALVAVEPTLRQSSSLAVDACNSSNPAGYTLLIVSDSQSGTTFGSTLANGREQRTCNPAGTGSCHADGSW
jgi:type IV pilus assembly protein PilA